MPELPNSSPPPTPSDPKSELRDFTVLWEIHIFDCDNAKEAAAKALAIQRDPNSTALVFDVTDQNDTQTRVDLLEEQHVT